MVKVRLISETNVVSLFTQRKEPLFAARAQIEGYWEGLRSEGQIPRRSDIDPRGIEDALEYAFILERIAPQVGRFRLAGMHLNDLMGMEVRGMPISAMFLPESRKEFGKLIEQLCTDPCVASLNLAGESNLGRPKMTAHMFLAPLRDDFGDVSRVFGCLQSVGSIGRQPRRFSVRNIAKRPISLSQNTTQQVNDMREPQNKRPDTMRPALKLVHSDS